MLFTPSPITWEQRKLGEVIEEYLELSEKDGSFEHVSLTTEGIVPKSARYNRDALVTHENKKYRVTHVDDICYNPANLKFGAICRNAYSDGIFSPIYVTFRVIENNSPAFVECIVRRKDFISKALRMQEGTVYERMAVKPVDLLSEKIALPSALEQTQISSLFQQLDALITLHQRKDFNYLSSN